MRLSEDRYVRRLELPQHARGGQFPYDACHDGDDNISQHVGVLSILFDPSRSPDTHSRADMIPGRIEWMAQ